MQLIAWLFGLSKNAWTVVTLIIHLVRALQSDPNFSQYLAELAAAIRDLLTKQDRVNMATDFAHDAPQTAFAAFLASIKKWAHTPY